jgi:hypothetical protein
MRVNNVWSSHGQGLLQSAALKGVQVNDPSGQPPVERPNARSHGAAMQFKLRPAKYNSGLFLQRHVAGQREGRNPVASPQELSDKRHKQRRTFIAARCATRGFVEQVLHVRCGYGTADTNVHGARPI